jgi:hypothetical protein
MLILQLFNAIFDFCLLLSFIIARISGNTGRKLKKGPEIWKCSHRWVGYASQAVRKLFGHLETKGSLSTLDDH